MHRRSLLAAAALIPLAAGCDGAPATKPAASSGKGKPFSFTPAGYEAVTVRLDRPADRIVTDIYSAAALQPYGIVPAGVWGYGHDSSGRGDLDLSKLNVLGLDGELSLEKLAAAKPDLIIGVGNQSGNGWTWWDEKVQAQATRIAPFVPIRMTNRMPDQMIEEYANLAGALGAQVDRPELARAKDEFGAALTRVRDVAARKPDLTVLALSGEADKVYTSDRLGVITMLAKAGVKFVGPKAPADKVWATSSWETIGEHAADVVLLMDFKEAPVVQEHPLFQRLPAVAAGQTGRWNDKRAYLWKGYATWLHEVADLLERSKNIVS